MSRLPSDVPCSMAAEMSDLEDQIAIVGIGCNFPGGEGIDNFWKVLVEGKNCTTEIPEERFNIKHWYDSDSNEPGKICTERAAFMEGINEFDHKLFGIPKFETENMDPQQKLLLECTYRALEDGGCPTESISGSDTGVFIGEVIKILEWKHLGPHVADAVKLEYDELRVVYLNLESFGSCGCNMKAK
ncbi:putative uncharacterized protein encoded by LINC00614 [Eleutherodactylus coqui]|uniref:putative uncharacterized protein encoded by LINC00614 n=1 Tax=Eleutherodactylus coqui TaxID=57060 RepID=UPI00346197EC